MRPLAEPRARARPYRKERAARDADNADNQSAWRPGANKFFDGVFGKPCIVECTSSQDCQAGDAACTCNVPRLNGIYQCIAKEQNGCIQNDAARFLAEAQNWCYSAFPDSWTVDNEAITARLASSRIASSTVASDVTANIKTTAQSASPTSKGLAASQANDEPGTSSSKSAFVTEMPSGTVEEAEASSSGVAAARNGTSSLTSLKAISRLSAQSSESVASSTSSSFLHSSTLSPMMNVTSTPHLIAPSITSDIPSSSSSSSGSVASASDLSTPAKAGIAVSAFCALAGLILVAGFLVRRRGAHGEASSAHSEPPPPLDADHDDSSSISHRDEIGIPGSEKTARSLHKVQKAANGVLLGPFSDFVTPSNDADGPYLTTTAPLHVRRDSLDSHTMMTPTSSDWTQARDRLTSILTPHSYPSQEQNRIPSIPSILKLFTIPEADVEESTPVTLEPQSGVAVLGGSPLIDDQAAKPSSLVRSDSAASRSTVHSALMLSTRQSLANDGRLSPVQGSPYGTKAIEWQLNDVPLSLTTELPSPTLSSYVFAL